MELETINKLYLELSQIATATTAKEHALIVLLKEAREKINGYVNDGEAYNPEMTLFNIDEALRKYK